MCPNFVRVAMGLIVLGREHGYTNRIVDLARLLEPMKNYRNDGTYYVVARAGHSVITPLHGHDNKWGQDFVYFHVNEFSMGSYNEEFCLSRANYLGRFFFVRLSKIQWLSRHEL